MEKKDIMSSRSEIWMTNISRKLNPGTNSVCVAEEDDVATSALAHLACANSAIKER